MILAHGLPLRRDWAAAALVLWAAGVGLGFAKLTSYESRPGAPAEAPPVLPNASAKPRLLLFLHPECPCSTATVAELNRLMMGRRNELVLEAYIFAPHTLAQSWSSSGMYRAVKAIPGAIVAPDPDGRFARSLRVDTSGQVLLYSPEGKLVFSGGITASRGHEGGNDGLNAVAAYLDSGVATRSTTPVFGCSFGLGISKDQPK